MAKIKELIKVQSSYSAQVNLKKEYSNRALNVERMANYRPIKAHRKAFEIIAEGAFRRDSKRCFILSGSYGTGKSHLSLMAANYFETPSDTPEMKCFFENYADSESDEINKKAEQLKGFRKQGRYLVSVCDYGANKLETYILKGIKEALDREGIAEEEMDSYYLQAIKKIDEWKYSDNEYFYHSLENLLEKKYNPWTINKLKEELSLYNKDAIEIFKEVHVSITTTEFEYKKDNYVEIISQMSQSNIIKEKFKGIIIFYDEFDYQLKSKRFDLDEFQKFAQMCAASFMSNFPIIFVATTHRSFASYKNVYNSEDFMTVNDRIKEIPLETEGIEEIISAIINPQKGSALWEEKIKPNVQDFNQLANECQQLNIFSWLPAPKVRKRIIENIYPMHPMATYSLLKLAQDVGSNNRSVFTFFADEKQDDGSYDWFVKNNEIVNKSGELQFYTLDLLFKYFKDKLHSDNQELRSTVKEYIKNFETSLRELSKQKSTSGNLELHDLLYERILRVMVIYQIIGVDITLNALKFALYANTEDKVRELEYCLKTATKNKIIYLNETNHCYEFRRSDALDINGLIKEYKEDEENLPDNWIEELQVISRHEYAKKTNKFLKDNCYLDALKYNFEYKEDKRLKREFVTIKDIEAENYFNKLLNQLNTQVSIKQSYEGVIVHVFCENEEEVKRAKNIAMKNSYEKIIIAVLLEEIAIFDEMFSLKAAISINKEEFSSQDSGMLKDYVLQYDNKLKSKLDEYIDSKNLIFYGTNGTILSKSSLSSDEAVKKFFEITYEEKRNLHKHEELNLIHEFKEKQNVALKEATEKLLDFSQELYYRNDVGADRGDIRYFKNVLLQTGVIKTSGTNQNRVMCDLEMDYSKYEKVLPALSAMIKEIKEADFHINVAGFINDYMDRYGIGYNSAILFFAIVKRYFKDSLTIIAEAGDIGSIKVTSYETLLELLFNQKFRNAVIQYKEIYEHDAAFIKQLHALFTNQSITLLEKEVTIDEVYEGLKEWYQRLDSINKTRGIYEKDSTVNFIDVFSQINHKNPRDFVLEEIKTIYGYDRQDLILPEKVSELIDKIKKDKELIEQGYYIVRDKIVEDIKDLFNIQETTYDGVQEKINMWFENLSDFQRSYKNEMHSTDSQQLALHLGKSTHFDELVTEVLPEAYRLKKIKEWQIDKSGSYIEKVRAGKRHIEENIFLVHPPKHTFDTTGDEAEEEEITESRFKIRYRQSINLKIIPSDEHSKVFITSNGENPQKETSQRQEASSPFEYNTEEDKTIKFCAIDKDGRYSKTIIVELENEDKKFVVKYVGGTSTQLGVKDIGVTVKEEPKVQVTLPRDADSLKQCIHSIIVQTKGKYGLNETQCIEVLKLLIEELRR